MVKKWPFLSHQFSGFFSSKIEKVETEKIVIYDVTCDPIEHPQNDCLKLLFVKYVYVVAKKMTRNGCKMSNSHSCGIYLHSEYNFSIFDSYDMKSL